MSFSSWLGVVVVAGCLALGGQASELPTVVDEVRDRLASLVVDAGPIRVEPNIDCGRHAMAAIHLAMGDPVDWPALREQLAPRRTGSSLKQLADYARGRGLFVLAVQLRSEDLPRLRYPAVLHVRKGGDPTGGPNHFMVTLPSPVEGVVAFDPPRHLQEIAPSSLDPVWAGHALIVAREPITAGDVLAPGVAASPVMAGAACVGGLALAGGSWWRRRHGPART
jgi:hypothetical protein